MRITAIKMLSEALRLELTASCRRLLRSKWFALSVSGTLALGFGATGVVFGVLDRALLQTPSGVPATQDVRRLRQDFQVPLTHERRTRDVFSIPELVAAVQSVEGVGLTAGYRLSEVPVGANARETAVTFVAGDYFRALAAAPLVGRYFDRRESDELGATVAVISERYWENELGASPDALGSKIRVGLTDLTIIGIAPRAFAGLAGRRSDVWVPFRQSEGGDSLWLRPRPFDLQMRVVVRASAGRRAPAQARLAAAIRSLDVTGDENAVITFVPIAESMDGGDRGRVVSILALLLVATVIILIIASANAANLVAMRIRGRIHEIAIRVALGSPSWRLALQLGTECFFLILGGLAFASVIWRKGTMLLGSTLMPDIDWTSGVLGWHLFAVGLIALALVTAALTKAVMRAAENRTTRHLGYGRGGTVQSKWAVSAVILIQVTSAFVLVVVSSAFGASLRNMERQSVGFRTDGVVLVSSTLGAGSVSVRPPFFETLSRLPGVISSAQSVTPPIRSLLSLHVFAQGSAIEQPQTGELVDASIVSEGFLETLNIPIHIGRSFRETDRLETSPVILVSVLFARSHWPSDSPLGKCVFIGTKSGVCRTVIGVVDDVNAMKIVQEPTQRVYLPMRQMSGTLGIPTVLLLRTSPARSQFLVRSGAAIVRQQDGGSAWRVQPLSEIFAPELRPWRTSLLLFGALGVIAVFISVTSVFSTVAHAVAYRTHEIAVRRALGATGFRVTQALLCDLITIVGAGVATATLLLIVAASWVNHLLYKASISDPLLIGMAMIIMTLAALLGLTVPVWRAVRVPPNAALVLEST